MELPRTGPVPDRSPGVPSLRRASGEGVRRIQLRRTKGWRKPANTVVVSRPSRWGNPYRPTFAGHVTGDPLCVMLAVQKFQHELWAGHLGVTIADVKRELRGKNLACWCPLPGPGQRDLCHASVLLELANR